MATLIANIISAGADEFESRLYGTLALDRWFIVDGRVSVYQTPFDPPSFIILSSYPGLRQVLYDLSIPDDPRAIYYSCFLRGGDYAKATGEGYKKSQLFTVELFGRFLFSVTGEDIEREVPRRFRPTFWNDSTGEEVAIWRTRVYSQPLSDLGICPARPMSPYSPWFPYLERRWHPARDEKVLLLGGLEKFRGGFALLHKFYRRASSILLKAPVKWGRPPKDSMEFYKAVVRVHNMLWIRDGVKPGKLKVALAMDSNDSTFNSKWAKTGMHWDDIPGPFDLNEK